MRKYYRRKTPGMKENLEAGVVAMGLAAGVGAVAFYLLRILRSREPLDPLPPDPTRGSLPASSSEDADTG